MTGAADDRRSRVVHASCVAFAGRALLILGPSGSGKSALALDLMALGGGLVADDRTELARAGAALVASCPPAIAGRIEARGTGLLRADPHPPAPVVLAVDLARAEAARLPPRRETVLLGLAVPLVWRSAQTAFPAALRQYMLAGRSD
jgi:HPr kinase/phosphorylase